MKRFLPYTPPPQLILHYLPEDMLLKPSSLNSQKHSYTLVSGYSYSHFYFTFPGTLSVTLEPDT